MEQNLEYTVTEEPGCDKKDYRERYKKIAQSDSFKSSYYNKSLGKEESSCEANCTTKNEDFDEELDNFLKDPVFGKLINRYAGMALARHFTEWQKKKDQETIELAEDHAMLAGMNKMEEEMMKNAVECIVEDWCGDSPEITIPLNPKDFKTGDKVKIIIVKEDKK